MAALEIEEGDRCLNKSQCMDCRPKKWPLLAREVAVQWRLERIELANP